MCRAALGQVWRDRRVQAAECVSGRIRDAVVQQILLHGSHQGPYSASSRAENTVTSDFRRNWGGDQESREKPMVTSVLLGVPSAVRDQRAESRCQV